MHTMNIEKKFQKQDKLLKAKNFLILLNTVNNNIQIKKNFKKKF